MCEASPEAPPLLAEPAATILWPLPAHGVAHRRGLDVDRPRQLAKTVTVE